MVREFHFKDFTDLGKLDPSIEIKIGVDDEESAKEILRFFPESKVFAVEPGQRAVQEFKKLY
jgi:hypothetical protein